MQGIYRVKLCDKLVARTPPGIYLYYYISRNIKNKSTHNSDRDDLLNVSKKKEVDHLEDLIFPGEYFPCEETFIQRKKLNITVPTLKKRDKLDIQTAASLYMTNTAIAWAKLSNENNHIIDWNIAPMPQNAKKWHVSSIYEMVLQISSVLPKADVFVLEDIKRPHANQSVNPVLLANMHLMECTTAMLFMYLNYLSVKHESEGGEHQHKVYFLKQYITARLSNTLIGGERVSAQSVVMDILNNAEKSSSLNQYSPISVNSNLRSNYLSQQSLERESMSQALLLLMTFMDLAVRERKESVNFINNSSNISYSEKKHI